MKLKRFAGDKVLYFVFAALLITLGVILLPQVTDLGVTILNYTIAGLILAYVVAFLVPQYKASRGKILMLVIVESVIMVLIALGLVLASFRVINVSEACAILGLALAMRGIVAMFQAYYHQFDSKAKYPLSKFLLNLIILIFGVYIFANPFVSNATLVIVLAVIVFVIALFCLICGFMIVNNGKGKKSKSKAK